MSLVNDALKKARLEAARDDAAKRSIPYPLLGRGEQKTSGLWIVALGALVVLAGLGGLFLYRAGENSALRASLVEPAGAHGAEAAKIPALGEPAEPAEAAPEPSAGPTRRSDPEPGRSRRQPAAPREALRSEPRPTARPGPAATDPERSPGSVSGPGSPAAAPPPAPPATPAETPALGEQEPDAPPRGVEPPQATPIEGPSSEAAPQGFLRRADIPGIGPIELGGIAWSGDRPFALVNGRVVRPGDSVSGLLVYDIQPNTVRFRGDQGILVFKLK